MKRDSYIFGVFITLLGGIFWGFSGTCGQFLFTQKGVSADWLVPYRLLLSGLILLGIYAISRPKIVLSPLKNPKNLPQMLLYSLIGLMMTQYSYFYAIELSNAAVATVIQYTAPIFILIAVCFFEKRLPFKKELIALILAILGVFFLATHGSFQSFAISHKALFFCFVSALSVVVYNLAPKRLNAQFPISLILGWGLLIGGITLSLYMRVWQLKGVNDFSGVLALLGVVFLGTIFAFSFYLTGVKIIGATRASLIAAIEPFSAAVFLLLLAWKSLCFYGLFGVYFDNGLRNFAFKKGIKWILRINLDPKK